MIISQILIIGSSLLRFRRLPRCLSRLAQFQQAVERARFLFRLSSLLDSNDTLIIQRIAHFLAAAATSGPSHTISSLARRAAPTDPGERRDRVPAGDVQQLHLRCAAAAGRAEPSGAHGDHQWAYGARVSVDEYCVYLANEGVFDFIQSCLTIQSEDASLFTQALRCYRGFTQNSCTPIRAASSAGICRERVLSASTLEILFILIEKQYESPAAVAALCSFLTLVSEYGGCVHVL